MRKSSTFVFLLLLLMYLGTHASCYQKDAGSMPPNTLEYAAESGEVNP